MPSLPLRNLDSTTSCLGNVRNGRRAAFQAAQTLVNYRKQEDTASILFDIRSQRAFATQRVVDRTA